MRLLSRIEGCDWVLQDDGSIVVDAFMRIDTDGRGDHHGDKTAQGETTYKPSLDTDVDFFGVVPGKIRMAVAPIVIGAKMEVLDLRTGERHALVCGDVGPNTRSGEVSRITARYFGINPDPNRGGWDESRRFRYTIWPGVPAEVGPRSYHLLRA